MTQQYPVGQGDILVVEDTPASLRLLTELLRQDGYSVREAPNGELALWSAQSRPPELILLDVRMPGIDGFEVCRRLKQTPALAAIPVIFLSAQHDTEDKVQGFQCGAVDFIGKPYQSEEVLARARVHIRLARAQNALGAANNELAGTLAQLRAARAQLLRSERLAALAALVSGVAHELNTPIGNSVLSASTLAERTREFAALMQAGLRRSDIERYVIDASTATELLLRNLDKSARLIGSFKQLASDQPSAHGSCFDLATLLDEIKASLLPALAEARASLRIEVAPGIAMENYPAVLCQIVSQLVLNALLHGFGQRDNGAITLAAHADAAGQLTLRVSDNGAGIAAEHIDKVFDPFFTTKFGQGSNGLGLNIVHNLVSNVLGGRIGAHSDAGHTCFVLEFPCVAPDLLANRGHRAVSSKRTMEDDAGVGVLQSRLAPPID